MPIPEEPSEDDVEALVDSVYKLPPQMTHEFGKHWKQPDHGKVQINGHHACMTQEDYEKLLHYECSAPTGCYEGKMWRCREYLCWFDAHPTDPDLCRTHTRLIKIVVDLPMAIGMKQNPNMPTGWETVLVPHGTFEHKD